MHTVIFDFEQQLCCETQAAIAQLLYIDGESDGFEGVRLTSFDSEYLLGYICAYRRKLADIQRTAQMLEAEASIVKANVTQF